MSTSAMQELIVDDDVFNPPRIDISLADAVLDTSEETYINTNIFV